MISWRERFGLQADWTRAAAKHRATTCENGKTVIAPRRNAKLGDMVLVVFGMRILSVEANATRLRKLRNCHRFAAVHEFAAMSRMAAPDAITSPIYDSATLDM